MRPWQRTQEAHGATAASFLKRESLKEAPTRRLGGQLAVPWPKRSEVWLVLSFSKLFSVLMLSTSQRCPACFKLLPAGPYPPTFIGLISKKLSRRSALIIELVVPLQGIFTCYIRLDRGYVSRQQEQEEMLLIRYQTGRRVQRLCARENWKTKQSEIKSLITHPAQRHHLTPPLLPVLLS